MKKFIKSNKRKGFTLVETMLSVFILVVMSTMLVSGFITTMGYSYQTAIYNKSAAMNYSMCMNETGAWNRRSNYLAGGREDYIANSGSTLTKKTVTFVTGPDYTSCESLYVVVDRNTNLDGVVPGSLPYMDSRYAPTNDNVTPSYVDNRTTFYYYPEYVSAGGTSHAGEVIVMIDDSNKNDIKYNWVVVPAADNPGVYITDEETQRTVINYDFNLANAKNTIDMGQISVS